MIGHHFSISAFWKAASASGVCCSRGGISCPTAAKRVRMLRRAFEATLNDPLFRDEAQKLGFEITPRTGEQLEALIRSAKEASPEIIERITRIIQSPAN